jgi:hypothetical protein
MDLIGYSLEQERLLQLQDARLDKLESTVPNEGVYSKVPQTQYNAKMAQLDAKDATHTAAILDLDDKKLDVTTYNDEVLTQSSKDGNQTGRLDALDILVASKVAQIAYDNKVVQLTNANTNLANRATDLDNRFDAIQTDLDVRIASEIDAKATDLEFDNLATELRTADSTLAAAIATKVTEAAQIQVDALQNTEINKLLLISAYDSKMTALDNSNANIEAKLLAVDQFIRLLSDTYVIKDGDGAVKNYSANYQSNLGLNIAPYFSFVSRNGNDISVQLPAFAYNTFYGKLRVTNVSSVVVANLVKADFDDVNFKAIVTAPASSAFPLTFDFLASDDSVIYSKTLTYTQFQNLNNTVAVNAPVLSISGGSSDFTYTVGQTADITFLNTGDAWDTATISPALGNGLSFSSVTQKITGTCTGSQDYIIYTLTATNAGGTATKTFGIVILPQPPNLSYNIPAVLETGKTYSFMPVNTGGSLGSLDFTGGSFLPNGLDFNNSTGEIFGTPTSAAPSTTYTFDATNSGGTTSVSFTFSIVVPRVSGALGMAFPIIVGPQTANISAMESYNNETYMLGSFNNIGGSGSSFTVRNRDGSIFRTLTINNTNTYHYVTKYSAAGVCQWFVMQTNPLSFADAKVCADGLYVVGTYAGASMIWLDGASGNSQASSSVSIAASGAQGAAVVIKYSLSGTPQWANSVDRLANAESGSAIAVDKLTNGVYLSGTTDSSTNLSVNGTSGSTFTLTQNGSGNTIFIVKYNASGVVQYVNTLPDIHASAIIRDMNTDATGSLYCTGTYNSAVNRTLNAPSGTSQIASSVVLPARPVIGTHVFIIKYNSAGVPVYAAPVAQANGSGLPPSPSIEVDNDSFYLSLNAGDTDVDGVNVVTAIRDADTNTNSAYSLPIPTRGTYHVAIVKYTLAGKVGWVKTLDMSSESATDITVSSDAVYVSGIYTNATGSSITIDGVSSAVFPTTSGNNNGYVAKYNKSGVIQWVLPAKNTLEGRIFSTVTDSEYFYIGGNVVSESGFPHIVQELNSSGAFVNSSTTYPNRSGATQVYFAQYNL